MRHRSDPADHDAGWSVREITLVGTHGETLCLSSRWIEYSHAGKGKTASAFFVVSLDHEPELNGHDWQMLAFKDGSGKAHRYAVKEATIIGPAKLRLTKAG